MHTGAFHRMGYLMLHHVAGVTILVRVFSDVLVAFLYFDICHYLVANIKIWKSHLNIREGSD